MALLRVYVDETGDRGSSGASSAYFAFCALLVPEEDDPGMRAAVSQLRRDFGVPVGSALHWNKHAKVFPRRQRATDLLTALTTVRLVYVVVEKAAIPANAGMRSDHSVFYNYSTRLLMERVLLAANGWPGGPRDAVVRFGHVRGFDHSKTTAYLDHVRRTEPGYIPWRRLSGPIRFEHQTAWDGLQAADAFAGMLHAAITPDAWGNYEPQHFVRACPMLRSHRGQTWGCGFKVLGNESTFRGLPWWNLTEM